MMAAMTAALAALAARDGIGPIRAAKRGVGQLPAPRRHHHYPCPAAPRTTARAGTGRRIACPCHTTRTSRAGAATASPGCTKRAATTRTLRVLHVCGKGKPFSKKSWRVAPSCRSGVMMRTTVRPSTFDTLRRCFLHLEAFSIMVGLGRFLWGSGCHWGPASGLQ